MKITAFQTLKENAYLNSISAWHCLLSGYDNAWDTFRDNGWITSGKTMQQIQETPEFQASLSVNISSAFTCADTCAQEWALKNGIKF